MTLTCGHFGYGIIGTAVPAGSLTDFHVGIRFYFLPGFNIRRNLDDAANTHEIIPGFVVIGAGNHLVGCQCIALTGVQLGACHELRPGIHLHIVIGVGPGHTPVAACTCLGCTFGSNLLKSSDVSITGHIPCTGQRGGVCGFGIHGNRSCRAPGRKTAGIPVCQAFGRVASACTNFQVFQFYRCVIVSICADVTAFGFNDTFVIAYGFGVAGTNGEAKADGRIPNDCPAAGIVFCNKGQIRCRFRNSFRLFLSIFINDFNFFLYGFIGFFTHTYLGFRFGNSLGLVGRYIGNKRKISAVGFGMGHIRPFLADDRPC